MTRRCRPDPKNVDYKNYAARGISVCPEWVESPNNFVVWAEANGYHHGLRLDRIDNDLGYSPGNCRFVTPHLSTCNQRLIKQNNTTGFRGAGHYRKGLFVARVTQYGREILSKVGFPTAEAAARYRDAFCILNGVPLPLNFPGMSEEEAQQILIGEV